MSWKMAVRIGHGTGEWRPSPAPRARSIGNCQGLWPSKVRLDTVEADFGASLSASDLQPPSPDLCSRSASPADPAGLDGLPWKLVLLFS